MILHLPVVPVFIFNVLDSGQAFEMKKNIQAVKPD
jgi:hypothetical protein